MVFECGEEQLLERLRKRGETSGRADDNETTIRKRLATFTESTLPVVQHYQTKGKVAMVRVCERAKFSVCGTDGSLVAGGCCWISG